MGYLVVNSVLSGHVSGAIKMISSCISRVIHLLKNIFRYEL